MRQDKYVGIERNMVRIAIVEDEEVFAEELAGYLKKYQKESGEEIQVKHYRDGDEITSGYKPQFEMILMDIQMKFMDGMSAAEEIRKVDSEVIIIFITNTPQYAIHGYEVGALDYILKPVSYFAFSQKLNRAIEQIEKRKHTYVTISVKGGILRLDTSDIYYVESYGHNLVYHTRLGDHISAGTMKQAEELLKNLGFSRGNKCYLLNLQHVEGIQDKCAVVKGCRLQISRPRMNMFMQDLTRYWGEMK